MKLSPEILEYLQASGFFTASPVQAVSVPQLLSHRDVLCHAPTGSGKTLSFLVPLAQLYINLLANVSDRPTHRAFGLIIVPARELASQIASVAEPILAAAAKALPPGSPAATAARRVLTLTGGSLTSADLQRLQVTPFPLLVGTPGRLVDVLEARPDIFRQVELLILDEADRVLDVSFSEHVDRILRVLPRQRRTAVASATLLTRGPAAERLKICGLRNPIVVSLSTNTKPNASPDGDDDAAEGEYGVASVSVPASIDNTAVVVPSPTAKLGWLVSALIGLSGVVDAHVEDDTPASKKATKRPRVTDAAGVFPRLKPSRVPASAPAAPEVVVTTSNGVHRILVFCLTCTYVEWLHRFLNSPAGRDLLGAAAPRIVVSSLHGQMMMKQRRAAVSAFAAGAEGELQAHDDEDAPAPVEPAPKKATKKGGAAAAAAAVADAVASSAAVATGREVRVLLCTDVAARGLDFPNVEDVIQLDPPTDPATFVHRVGRTGRFGKTGRATLLLLPRETAYADYWRVRHAPLRMLDTSEGPIGSVALGLPAQWAAGATVAAGRGIREGRAPVSVLPDWYVPDPEKKTKKAAAAAVAAEGSTLGACTVDLTDVTAVGEATVDAVRGLAVQLAHPGTVTLEAAKALVAAALAKTRQRAADREKEKEERKKAAAKDDKDAKEAEEEAEGDANKKVKKIEEATDDDIIYVHVTGKGSKAIATVLDENGVVSPSAGKLKGKAAKAKAEAARSGRPVKTVEDGDSGVLLRVDTASLSGAAVALVSYVRACQEHSLKYILRISAADIPPLADAVGLFLVPSLTDSFGSRSAAKARSLRGSALRNKIQTKHERETYAPLVPKGLATAAVEAAAAARGSRRRRAAKARKAALAAASGDAPGAKDRSGLSLRNAAREEIREAGMSRRQRDAAWSTLEKAELAREHRATMLLKQGRITEEEFDALVADVEADAEVAAETDVKKRAAARRAVEARHEAIRANLSRRLLEGKAAAPTLLGDLLPTVQKEKKITPQVAVECIQAELNKLETGTVGFGAAGLRGKVMAAAQAAAKPRFGRRTGGGHGIFASDSSSDDE